MEFRIQILEFEIEIYFSNFCEIIRFIFQVRLDFGGADVTQTLHWLLKKCAFPYKDCDESKPQDAMLLKSLKEDFCHVNLVMISLVFISDQIILILIRFAFFQDICGSQEKSFKLIQPGKPHVIYTLQVGDECIVAPLALFNTELLNVTGTGKLAKTQKPAALQSDAEDCFDAEYLRETGVIYILIFKSLKVLSFLYHQRRGAREQLDQNQIDSGIIIKDEANEDDIVVDALDVERDVKPYDRDFVLPGGQIIGLDQAVLQSIERCRKF